MDQETKAEVSPEYELIYEKGFDAAATSAILSNLNEAELTNIITDWGREWTERPCNGSKVLILKKPSKAFEFYATKWTTNFKAVMDLLKQAKVNVGGEIENKIQSLFDNLDYVDANIKQMYYASYLTFMATACTEKGQEEKRRMDRLIAAASLQLVTLKMTLESKGIGIEDIDKIIERTSGIVDKITDIMIKL